MGWHSDDEPELDQNAPIASLSLGGERKFSFKHKADKTNVSLLLENGSVLLMHAPTQECFTAPKHVPPPQPYKITPTELIRIQEQNRHIHEQRINKVPHGTWVESSPEPVGVFALITKYLRKWFA
jgi:alkylated DNA repair dioxygenase AlkB